MASAKRPLTDVDGNARQPAPKRVSSGSRVSTGSAGSSATGDENADSYESMSKAELIGLLKQRQLPYSNVNKPVLIERLRSSDADGSPAGSSSSSSSAAASTQTELQWVTQCRPPEDIQAEKDNATDSEIDSDEEEDDQGRHPINVCADGTCMCKKPVKDYPAWKWIISSQALDKVTHLMQECWSRDQDAQGKYMYNDWNGYGVQEVMENELAAIDKSIKSNDIRLLWPHIEALATFMPQNNQEWWMTDVPDQTLDALEMIGGAVMKALSLLECNNDLNANSTIPNIALTLGQLQSLQGDWPGNPGEDRLSWCDAAVLKAKKAGVVFENVPYGIGDVAEELEEDTELEDDTELAGRWESFDWTRKFAKFSKDYRKLGSRAIGGTNYVLKKPKKNNNNNNKKPGAGGKGKGKGKGNGRKREWIWLMPGEDINDFV